MATPKIFKLPNSLTMRLNAKDIRIWDVRTPMEFIHGHIDGAENVPLDELERYPKEQVFNRDKTIVTCSTGDQRSTRACEMLKGRGMIVVDGGSWKQLLDMISEGMAEG